MSVKKSFLMLRTLPTKRKHNTIWLNCLYCKTVKTSTGIFFPSSVKKHSNAKRCPVKKVILEIWQNSQENTCARISFLIKLRAVPSTSSKRDSGTGGFFCEFCEIFKNTFFIEQLQWLLLYHQQNIKPRAFCIYFPFRKEKRESY